MNPWVLDKLGLIGHNKQSQVKKLPVFKYIYIFIFLGAHCKLTQCRVDLITVWPTFGDNNLHKHFQLWIRSAQQLGGILHHSSSQTFQVSNILGKPGGSLKVMTKHLTWIEVRTLTEPHQVAYFLLLKPFCCWFAPVLWVIVLLHRPSSLEFRMEDRWAYILLINWELINWLCQW